MGWYPGRPRNVNDPSRGIGVRQLRSMRELEGLPTQADVDAAEAANKKAAAEEAKTDAQERKAIQRVAKAIPVMRRRKDKRRKPSKVTSKTHGRWRKLKAK